LDGVRGVGVLERVAREAVAVAVVGGGRVPVVGEDFEGDVGGLVGLVGGNDGRDVEADARGLIAGAVVGAWVDVSGRVGPSPSAVDGIASGPAGIFTSACTGVRTSETGVIVGLRRVAKDICGLTVVPLVLPFVFTGGHSRAMRCSSFAESPVLLEAALAVRDDVVGGVD
jgi:hypothetical protein